MSTRDARYDEAEASQDSRPILVDELFLQEEVAAPSSYERLEAQGGDRFKDEPPSLAGPSAEPNSFGKSVGRIGGFLGEVVSKAVEAAADLFDSLFSGLFGGSSPPPSQSPQQAQPTRAQPLEQKTAPVQVIEQPQPERAKPQPDSAPQERSAHSFLEAMTQRLSAEDIARIEAKAAERAELRELPKDKSRDLDFDR